MWIDQRRQQRRVYWRTPQNTRDYIAFGSRADAETFREIARQIVGQQQPLVVRVGQVTSAQQPAQLFLHRPGRGDLVGQVVAAERSLQAGQASSGEGVAGAQEQASVRPRRVDGAAAALLRLPADALADLGQGVVGELDQGGTRRR